MANDVTSLASVRSSASESVQIAFNYQYPLGAIFVYLYPWRLSLQEVDLADLAGIRGGMSVVPVYSIDTIHGVGNPAVCPAGSGAH